MDAKKLTEFVGRFNAEHGYPPTFREIADHFGVSSTSTVHRAVHKLIEQGVLEQRPGASRTLVVVKNE